jgi:cell division protein FtsI/penicillin-binding protein 2
MKFTRLYVLVPALLIILMNILWGSVISWFLSIAIVGSLTYYLVQINLENFIAAKLNNATPNDDVKAKAAIVVKKYKAILSFFLMTLVFVSSIFCLQKTTRPGGSQPWFFNNDHYGISNRGIAFEKSLQLRRNVVLDSAAARARLDVRATSSGAQLSFTDFFEPVFYQPAPDVPFTPINNIFPASITQQFTISNGINTVAVTMQPQSSGIFGLGRERVLYTINLSCKDATFEADENVKLPFEDRIAVIDDALKEGKSLYSLFLENEPVEIGKEESTHVLDLILTQLGETYLLANYEGTQKTLSIFPSTHFFENGYKLYIGAEQIAPKTHVQAQVEAEKPFYIGFHNLNEKAFISFIDNAAYGIASSGNRPAFMFDYPPVYWLSSPSDKQQVGNKNLRFIANNNDDVLSNDLKEGFLFNNYRLNSGARISGNIDYLSGRPADSLSIGVVDNNRSKGYTKVTNGHFSLKAAEGGQHFLFGLRDFSDNGFSYNRLLLFAALMYIGMVLVLVFFPGKNLVRVEPIIFAVVYTLLMLRLLLYWRLATFPPVENISKYELEQTILSFDYRLGLQLPLPLTIIWLYLFLGFLIIYRWRTSRGKEYDKIITDRLKLHSTRSINRAYIIFISACFLVYVVNDKLLHIELWTRLGSILIPIIGYCLFATWSNRYFVFEREWVASSDSKIFARFKAYIHYLVNNPAFVITLVTIAFFILTDRGFAILFTLFVLLKNILFNFLKKPFDSERISLVNMFLRPNNYWFYGLASLVVYLTVLSFKSLFYYLITYKLVVALVLILIPTIVFWVFYRKQFKTIRLALTALAAVYLILLLTPATNAWMEDKATNAIRHVQYRASIIHQPISELLLQNEYSSFQTRKIIETAENQWFINSYIKKGYDNSAVINLRPYSKVGVNYNTQTRDVVIARFVIGELGNFTMYLILTLTLLPLVLYLMSYKFTVDGYHYKLNFRTYAGALPLILFFTISLFVWLTATNRFVFFGQDFPFLSLTSKLSVVMPLMLFAFVLIQQPDTHRSFELKLQAGFMRYVFFVALVAVFALSTVKSNELSNDNFSIVVEKTKKHIDSDLNAILLDVQDSLTSSNKRLTYAHLISALKNDSRFKAMLEDSVADAYTKSILRRLVEKPNTAFKVDNPLYMVYDNRRYSALYNQHLYLELPAIENKKVWHGSIAESLHQDLPTVNLTYNNAGTVGTLPMIKSDIASNVQLAILPASWFAEGSNHVGILNLRNDHRNKASLLIYKSINNNITQSTTAFANAFMQEDVVSIKSGNQTTVASFNSNGNSFAINKWINGNYRIMYPLKEQNFWMYSFANTVKTAFRGDSLMLENVGITLDYRLTSSVQRRVTETYGSSTKNNKRFKFSVIAADGDGNVRLMADHVANRIHLDPNDAATIFNLKQRHFFYSNVRNERDQWGNSNFLAMYLGPGSSIKPLIAATIASQINAGWESLALAPPLQAEYDRYAGFKLHKPWTNDDHYRVGNITLDKYIEASSNFYQSVLMFLGSYTANSFIRDGKASLNHVMSSQAESQSNFPVLQFQNGIYYLPGFNSKSKSWPKTHPNSEKRRNYFGNENSILANGLEVNANLRTKDKDKHDLSPSSYSRVNILDTNLYGKLVKNKSANFLWSFPEQSDFLQSERGYDDPQQNVNIGLKTATLGGYPYRIAPFKMLEMYMSLFTQNRNYSLHLMPAPFEYVSWKVDSSWRNNAAFNEFLAANIFKGMYQVIHGGSGTARALATLKSNHPNLFFYAKTGTINEQGSGAKNSRRLIVSIADKDLQQPENIGKARVYALYFVIDNNRDFDWSLLISIINESIESKSFQSYFNE